MLGGILQRCWLPTPREFENYLDKLAILMRDIYIYFTQLSA